MLTREAFNALLKTLEEPPSHVKFVLCTTEPEKLPITILSRCQRFDFQTVDPPAIARRLAQIVEAEGASVAQDALDLIARRAAGSMRDSQSLLEQLLGSATGPIGVDEVHTVIGTGREEKVGALVAAIAARDPRGAIEALDAALAGGADPGGVLEQLIAALRDCLLASVGCGPESLLQGQGLGVDLAAIGREVGTETLLAMLQIIDHALARMRTSGHAAVLAEMAVVRLAKLEDLDNLTALVHATPADKPASAPTAARRLPAVTAAPVSAPAARSAQPEREKKTTDLTPAAVAAAPSADEEAAVGVIEAAREPVAEPAVELATAMLPADAHAAWLQAGEAVGGLVADFAAMASRASWRDELLEVALPGDATTAISFLRRPEVSASLARVLGEIAGRPLKYAIVLEAVAAAPAAAARANGAAGEPAAPERPRPVHSQAALLREVMDHPLVTHARTLFDAAVRKVEPPRPQETTTVPAASVAADDDAVAGEEAAAGSLGGMDG
jgi:DNA polymerase-3 subunit gamma/tau